MLGLIVAPELATFDLPSGRFAAELLKQIALFISLEIL